MSDSKSENVSPLERLVAAEYVGGRSFTNQVGLSLVAIEQLAKIHGQQVAWFIEDQQTSWGKLMETMNPLAVWMDHMSRRGRHISSGVEQLFDAGREISTRGERLQHDLSETYDNVVQITPGAQPAELPRTHEDVLARLRLDHERLHSILKVTEQLVSEIESLGPRELDRLMCCVDYVAEYPDAVHHPLEDRLFGHLLALDLGEEVRQQVEHNAAKHEALAAATARLSDDIDALLEDKITREVLKTDAMAYIDMQRRHMAFEEEHIFGLAQQLLRTEAWSDSQDAEANDPLFDEHLDRFDDLYQYASGRL